MLLLRLLGSFLTGPALIVLGVALAVLGVWTPLALLVAGVGVIACFAPLLGVGRGLRSAVRGTQGGGTDGPTAF